MNDEPVRLLHGSGQGLQLLLNQVVLPSLHIHEKDGPLEDAALLTGLTGTLAFTTDSFVVNPLRFNGGDIGKLAACGTINDLAMMGAKPHALSVSLIIEEGLLFSDLKSFLNSLRQECETAGAAIVCGDTKVVDAGKGDGLYINTSGIGRVSTPYNLSAAHARPGDCVIVSGPIGQHGIAILAARQQLGFSSTVVSDCAALDKLALTLLEAVPETRVLRDATRGGCAAVLNEIADASNVTITLDQAAIPVQPGVAAACDYLGLDPLQVANEGRFVAVVPEASAGKALGALKRHPLGKDSALIGQVELRERFGLLIQTEIGGKRIVEMPSGLLLPRIC
ncbi:MAG: hydrogenase expression/formation protein HypE [Proteobacteria bacterium]|nr:hydrogenase expression/formation protein HypE [Pseudomonadota bacterium]